MADVLLHAVAVVRHDRSAIATAADSSSPSPDSGLNPALVETLQRCGIRAWWLMCSGAGRCVSSSAHRGHGDSAFRLISFWALREFITLTPTRLGDHRALFWVFFFFTPLQYCWWAWATSHYGLYQRSDSGLRASCSSRRGSRMAGDYKRFLERTAKIQAGLMICVYCLSYAPALLYLPITPADRRRIEPADRARLLFFFVLMVQTQRRACSMPGASCWGDT